MLREVVGPPINRRGKVSADVYATEWNPRRPQHSVLSTQYSVLGVPIRYTFHCGVVATHFFCFLYSPSTLLVGKSHHYHLNSIVR